MLRNKLEEMKSAKLPDVYFSRLTDSRWVFQAQPCVRKARLYILIKNRNLL
jgi:hypothetical protein